MTDPRVNDLDQELFFSELAEPLVQPLLPPLLLHMVAPFVNGNDPNFSLQINGKMLWEWRKLEGNLKKLFVVFQANLRPNGYKLEESAFDRISVLLSTKTATFVNKIKAERNGKMRERKKAETWLKLCLYSNEIRQSPYDIYGEMNEKRKEQNATIDEQAAKLYEEMTQNHQHKGKHFSDVSSRQQRRHLLQIQ